MASHFDDISINTMIGSGSTFSGDLKVFGGLMVGGDINGNIETSGNIIIAERARVKGNIIAKSAVVSGIVIGDIVAPDGVKLQPSSAVIGDVFTHKLQVADKVVIHGHCISIPDDERFERQYALQRQSKEIRNRAFSR